MFTPKKSKVSAAHPKDKKKRRCLRKCEIKESLASLYYVGQFAEFNYIRLKLRNKVTPILVVIKDMMVVITMIFAASAELPFIARTII